MLQRQYRSIITPVRNKLYRCGTCYVITHKHEAINFKVCLYFCPSYTASKWYLCGAILRFNIVNSFFDPSGYAAFRVRIS